MLFQDATNGENLLKFYVENETTKLYLQGIHQLEIQGFKIKAVVCDGHKGLIQALQDRYIVQFCQYHQASIIRHYLSQKPKHQSGKDLKYIVSFLTSSTKIQFSNYLDQWFDLWEEYLNERSINPETGRTHYTHRRLRSAYRSLRNNLPFLFTYQKDPDLGIPNTSNKIEGSFGHLKTKIRCHPGLSKEQKIKIIDEILKV